MEKGQKSGIESIVKARQKKDIVETLETCALTAVSAIGSAGSISLFAYSAYRAVVEYIRVEPSMVEAAKAMEEPSPYSDSHVCIIIAIMAGMAAITFTHGFIEGIKHIRE